MGKFIVLLAAVASFEAGAVDLSAGESTNINGTQVTCQASASKCTIVPCGGAGWNRVAVDGKPVGEYCLNLKDIIDAFKQLKDAGVCN